ncbi:Rossmann-like and DUF2520 domain-containing protein [Dethiobacter alkaliphilus]|uniref:NADP oxidoreductase coenzyme F420-dependent n=1 Tax=Dethiobacter alkaliphilus AHT 1 TaxID=555088 RepID=C0GHP9_DETAL|nr:NADP oxidoreductase coenzyme F420-dependent [Dethiobacter alkaliphilus AHT 1]
MKIAIVGAGNVGTSLAVLLQQAGHQICGIASRTESSAARAAQRVNAPYSTEPTQFTKQADLVFITTPDRVISEVCHQIASQNGFKPQSIVAHTSGAHSSKILDSAAELNARPISFHPLQTFANPDAGIKNLPGSFITIEGQEEALPAARQLVDDLSCKLLEIPTEGKELYHAAACIACNYFTTLIDSALTVMEKAGVKKEDGLPALYPLIAGTLKNISQVGTTNALTGPIARGDTQTVQAHLTQMEKQIPEIIPLYHLLGQATADVATAKGTLGSQERQNLLKILGGADND